MVDFNKTDHCGYFEALLVNEQLGALNEDEKRKLSVHLESCSNCRIYRLTLLELAQKSGQNIPKLIPDPKIKRELSARLLNNNREKTVTFRQVIGSVQKILTRPIPAYQAALGVALVLLFFFLNSTPQFTFETDRVDMNPQQNHEIVIPDFSNALDNLNFAKNQRIGINVKEDTIFTRYISTAM